MGSIISTMNHYPRNGQRGDPHFTPLNPYHLKLYRLLQHPWVGLTISTNILMKTVELDLNHNILSCSLD